MSRPPGAQEALGLGPLFQTGRADSARVESVPFKVTRATPAVVFTRRTAAKRTADARA